MEANVVATDSTDTFTQKTIVIVDDVRELRLLFTDFLRDQGYKVVDVAQGTLALDTVKKSKAHLVILDLMLPDIDGNEVLRQLKHDSQTSHVPVMVISAYPRWLKPDLLVLAARVMRKPFELDELLEAIQLLTGDNYHAEAS